MKNTSSDMHCDIALRGVCVAVWRQRFRNAGYKVQTEIERLGMQL